MRLLPRLLRADGEQPLQLTLVRAQRLVALPDRSEQPDDRLGDVLLELSVAPAVVARLDVGNRIARRHGHDLDQVRDAGLRVTVVAHVRSGIRDRGGYGKFKEDVAE